MNSSKNSEIPAVGDSPKHCEVPIFPPLIFPLVASGSSPSPAHCELLFLPPRWQNPHLTINPCELPQAVRSQEESRDLRVKITNRSLTRTSIEAMISLKS